MHTGALRDRVQTHEQGVTNNRVRLQPAHATFRLNSLRHASISGVYGFTLSVTLAEPHPSRTFKSATYGQSHRAVNRAGVGMIHSQAYVANNFRGVIDFTMRHHHIDSIGLLRQGEILSPSLLPQAFGLSAGVFNRTADNLM
jgi:hypothetical protein